MTPLLLLLALGLAGATPVENHKVCQPHSRPWQVRLHGDGVTCSGALIDKWWLVTAFHCAPIPYRTTASLGEHDVTVDEGTEQRILVADVIRHSPYRSPLHSLTMVRLSEPARFNQYVQPIALPHRCPQPGEVCSVSGWGSTIPNLYEPDELLKCITVPVVDDQTCMNSLPNDVYWSSNMVCAGQANTDNCMNDAGSVMVCDGQLQGVQWYGQGCNDPADSTAYTNLCMYNGWIKTVMENFIPLPTMTVTTKSERTIHLLKDNM